jgi:Flp pilus assembly protein TadG
MRRFFAKRRGNRGSTLILVLMMLPVFLIPLVGLGIDGTMLFLVQAKLSAAADGAVLGAGRLLGTSANTTEIAGEFLNVNFPAGYWGSTNLQSTITATDVSGLHTISLNATVQVPLLFMRILGQSSSTVAASAVASKRDVRMMIVVDRSGSVVEENANPTIVSVLDQFVANSSTSAFVDGRDEIGMISFGASWKLDFSPTIYFQSSTPNIGTAIGNIPFTQSNGTSANSGTNTAEGLYQAWYQLRQINDPTALNVILLLTDGRPSGFTGNFTSTSQCKSTYPHGGVLQSYVGLGTYPFWPPPTSGADVIGISTSTYQGVPETNYVESNSSGCGYSGGASTSVETDIPTIPANAGPIDNVGSIPQYTTVGVPTQTQGYYLNFGNSTSDPKSIRYAAFNVADNIATLIRQDTVVKPVLFVIGLSYSGTLTEPLDSDWLARIANDPSYVIQTSDPDAHTTAGNSVYQSGQTAGWYYLSNLSTLQQAFSNVSSQILRLSQ